jgi:hypothetical protein
LILVDEEKLQKKIITRLESVKSDENPGGDTVSHKVTEHIKGNP